MAKQERSERLDTPGRRTGWLPKVKVGDDAFGDFAESAARYMGTGKFIIWMSVFIIGWILWNVFFGFPDEFPFIFLTLLLSLQASYAAPLILLAQNRQDDRDRVQYQEDRDRTDRLIADTEYLMREIAALRIALGEVATRDYMRGELKDLAELIEERIKETNDDPSAPR